MSTDSSPACDSVSATRGSLLLRIENSSDAQSWTEFYGIYKKLVLGFALRLGLRLADAEEVTQDVFKQVAENISKFECDPARGSFRGWLLKFTRWRVMDRLRVQCRHEQIYPPRRGEPAPDRTNTIERAPDTSEKEPDVVWEREWEHRVLELALEKLARRVDARHFQIFEYQMCQGWPVRRIARCFNVNPGTVYVINHRLKKELKREVAKWKKQLN